MPRIKQILIALVITLTFSATASANTYWHFTFTIFKASDQSEREWTWITMVEIPRARVYPGEAATVRRMGGQFEGTLFAFVRGAAWRAAHSETRTLDCGNISGPRGSRETLWHESESESVFAHGGVPTDENDFRIGINSRPILREDGTRLDPRSQPHVFAAPISGPGDPDIRLKGSYKVLGINYKDPNVYYRQKCPGKKERMWAKQFKSKLIQFGSSDSLRDSLIGNSTWNQRLIRTRGDQYTLVYSAIRSSSSRHPHWKRQTM